MIVKLVELSKTKIQLKEIKKLEIYWGKAILKKYQVMNKLIKI